MASGLHFLLLLLLCSVSSEARLRIFEISASDLPSDIFGITDAYIKVSVGSQSLGQTKVKDNQVNPWWEEEFYYSYAQQDDVLRLEVHDEDTFFDDLLGICSRQLQYGTHRFDCFLEEKGVLHYSYTLDSQ
ncbi:probable ADP-ribosylation factor GTPase-activating protein AGD13 [Salarias fasciatus]|uniref:Probable ADP-ribosylation factor GTPase-activating protein AGD13 n=1 Tax=Salarias fasciatus TaxID=181472 RepID=A0A672FR65_SALFA|nr:probable ADP-ribosylation factor GTPase-activating protein AGD13 [Salarias fasciatus]